MANNLFRSKDPWLLGKRLASDVLPTNSFLEHREQSPSTLAKVTPRLEILTDKYQGTPVYGTGSALYSPYPQGVGIGPGVVSGKLAGFSIGEINPLTNFEKTHPRDIKLGVIALIGESMFRAGHETTSNPSWRLNVLPEAMREHYDRPGYVIGLPVSPDTKMLKLHIQENPANVADLLEAADKQSDPQAVEEAIDTIYALTNGDAIDKNIDPVHYGAVLGELNFLNANSSLVGGSGTYNAQLSWSPDFEHSNGALLQRDQAVTGDFRKFIYGICPDENGSLKYAVQLVVYPPEITEQVRRGIMTPQEADALCATYIIF